MIADSTQKMLTVGEIIEEAMTSTGVNRPMKEAVQMLQVELSMPQIWKCREGNKIGRAHV